jgi:hypothetical protein
MVFRASPKGGRLEDGAIPKRMRDPIEEWQRGANMALPLV